ncbi:unnamed protein product [Caenorhabditis brenneri]
MGVSVGKEMLDPSLRVANDVAAGDSFKRSLSKNATTSYNSLFDRAIGKLDQSGGRRRRKTKQKTNKKTRKVKKSGKKGNKEESSKSMDHLLLEIGHLLD